MENVAEEEKKVHQDLQVHLVQKVCRERKGILGDQVRPVHQEEMEYQVLVVYPVKKETVDNQDHREHQGPSDLKALTGQRVTWDQ
jgi:hypothetical protein